MGCPTATWVSDGAAHTSRRREEFPPRTGCLSVSDHDDDEDDDDDDDDDG